ncbi:MAG: outer membrane protein assembly factor BamD [Nitrospira sp.]|nr:outer membrane protein assembly factor BamD [Nitrospira sp.]
MTERNLKILILSLLALIFFSCSSKPPVVKPPEPFDPEKALAKAGEQIEKKEYAEARATLLEVKNRDMSKKYAPLAQLKTADSYIQEGEPELAVIEYQRFIETYPDHKYAVYAQYQIAMTYFNQIESPDKGYGAAARALHEFEKLKRMFPRNPYRDVINLRIEKCKNVIADYEFFVGEFYYKKGSYTAALARFEGLLKKFPEYKREPEVLYHIVMVYKNLGQEEKGQEYLQRLIDKYPDNKITLRAQREFSVKK